MSNQNPKSDEMLKSYVAQIASQGVAMFLQQRQEAEAERLDYAETENELRSRIQWLTDKCEEFEATIDEQKEQISRLSKINSSLRERIDRCQNLNREGSKQVENLKKEIESCKATRALIRQDYDKISLENFTLKSQITVLKNDRDDYKRRYEDLRDLNDDHDPFADVLASLPDSTMENAKGVSA